MTQPLPRALRDRLAAEYERRRRAERFEPERLCFAPQLAFVRDRSRHKVACCSRRAGKTVACAVLLLLSALGNPGTTNLYLTLSRVSGKRIVWRTLLKLNRDYNLGGRPNLAELTLTFPNEAVIIVSGAKDESECEKLRGNAYHLVVIDEAQSFREYLGQLVDDIIAPALMDTKGSLVLLGTPGKVRAGYFYDAIRSGARADLREKLHVEPPANDNGDEEGGEAREWSVHHWTIHDNPHIADVEDELARLRRRKGWTEEHPTYQREYLGRWVAEHDALVYKYDAARNGYEPHERPDLTGPAWQFIISVDQGVNDADVIGVLAISRSASPKAWYVEEHVKRGDGAGALCEKAVEVYGKYKGRVLRMFFDEAGIGKKVAEDARNKYGLPVEPAEKPGKIAAVEATNDLLRRGVLMVPRNSQAAADAPRVTWDPKARGVKFSEKYHTDAWDTIVYGVRAIPKGYLPPMPSNEPETPDDLERKRLEREAEEKRKRIAARIEEHKRSWVDKAAKKRDPRRLLR